MTITHEPHVENHLKHLYARDRQRHAFVGSTADDAARWAAQARPALAEVIGLNRIAEQVGDFQSTVSMGDVEQRDGYTRQLCVLHSEPTLDVPFWFVRPLGDGPFSLAIYPHGHYAKHGLDYAVGQSADDAMAEKIKAQGRDVALQGVRHGFAGIAPVTRGFAPVTVPDISKRHDGRDCRSYALHAMLAGRTAIGERVWDMQRLIDWGSQQPGIDASTVLMMGNSGGGVVTLYGAAIDTRVTIAVASCSFAPYVSEGGLIHHCDCNLVPGILQFGEFWDVVGLIAPRRLLVVHGAKDPLFPLAEVDRAVAGAQHIFDVAGVPNHLAHQVGPLGHQFYPDRMWPFVRDGSNTR